MRTLAEQIRDASEELQRLYEQKRTHSRREVAYHLDMGLRYIDEAARIWEEEASIKD